MTIADVAEYCGVSKATVSRYLNGKSEGFSEDTRERIRQAIEFLDYKPDKTAQRMKSARTKLIGCVLADISSPFTGILLKGIMTVCEREGYQVLFTECGEDKGREIKAIEGFLLNKVDGVIVNTCGDNEDFLSSVKGRGVPIVLADRGFLGEHRLDTISHANRESAIECVAFLKGCGYDRVAFFTQGNKNVSPRILRYEGYKEGMARFYPGVAPEIYVFDSDDEDSCLRQIELFRSSFPGERIAILSANGVTTRCLLLAFGRTGYSWGKDYGLCSYDDWDWLRLSSPGITSVWQPSEEIGERSAQLLIEYIEGKRSLTDTPLDIKLKGKLNVRGSTIKIAP